MIQHVINFTLSTPLAANTVARARVPSGGWKIEIRISGIAIAKKSVIDNLIKTIVES